MFDFNLGIEGLIRLQVFRKGFLISDTSHKNNSTEALTRLSQAYGDQTFTGSVVATGVANIKVDYPGLGVSGQSGYVAPGNEVESAAPGDIVTSTPASTGRLVATIAGFSSIACPQNGLLGVSLRDSDNAVVSSRVGGESITVTSASGIAFGDTVTITYTLTISGLASDAASLQAVNLFKTPAQVNNTAQMRFSTMGIYTDSSQVTEVTFSDATNSGSSQTDADGFSDADEGPVQSGTAAAPKPIKMQKSIQSLTNPPHGAWIKNSIGTIIKTADSVMSYDAANSGRRHSFKFITRFTGQ